MEERVALVGGSLMIRLLNPSGVRIVASIPLEGRLASQPVADITAKKTLTVA
jgi:hypothetical protein